MRGIAMAIVGATMIGFMRSLSLNDEQILKCGVIAIVWFVATPVAIADGR